MAIRTDHSFGLEPKYMIQYYDKENVIPRAHRQIKMIRAAKLFYDWAKSDDPTKCAYQRDTYNALIDEMFGKGSYRPEGEEGWLVLAHADAQREAIQLATDVVSKGTGPIPEFTVLKAVGDEVIVEHIPPEDTAEALADRSSG